MPIQPTQRRWFILGASALATLALAIALQVAQADIPGKRSLKWVRSAPAPVLLTTVEAEPVSAQYVLYGVARSTDRATLSFTLPGRVAQRFVSAGSKVSKGQQLAALDAAPFQHASARASSGAMEAGALYAQLKRELERSEKLNLHGVVHDQHLEQLQTRARATAAAFASALTLQKEAKRQQGEASLVAPFAGVVTDTHLQVGEFAQPGSPVVTIVGDSTLEVLFEASVAAAFDAEAGQKMNIFIGHLGGPIVQGTIRSVAKVASGPGHLFPILVDLEADAEVAAGMNVIGGFNGPKAERLTVPLRSVMDAAGKQPEVFRVKNGTASLTPIEIGALVGSKVTITSGLNAGDLVVVEGVALLLDGDPVRDSRPGANSEGR